MYTSLYVGTNGHATGKRLVSLGMMELASRRFERVGFFRPVVRIAAQQDPSIRLMKARYGLKAAPESSAGVTRAQTRQMLAEDRYSDLIQLIQQRFKELEADSDFVVVEGTSFQGLAPELEFELNADIAVNLGCCVLSVFSMGRHTVDECVQSVLISNDSLVDHGAQLMATIINQVPEHQQHELRQSCLAKSVGVNQPLYLIPEEPSLRQPTVREFQIGIGAQLLRGSEASLDREVSKLQVAAMLLPEFSERMTGSSLVMTPGDRSDILIGCALACSQPEGRAPAAVVLTGGLLPPPSINRLIENTSLPILTSPDDTYTVASKAAEVRASIGEHSPRKVASAIGLFERSVDVEELANRLMASSIETITPMLFEHSLIQQARQQQVTVVLPEGAEPRILQAADVLRRRDVARLILLGNPDDISASAASVGLELKELGVDVIDPANSPLRDDFAREYQQLRQHKGITLDTALDRMQDVNYFGTMMVHRGLAGGLVSGSVHTTANTIRPAFEVIKTKPGVAVVSSVFLMCLKNGVSVYGDCAVIPNPTSDQLASIAISSAQTAQQFGIEPRVAMLSYSTGQSGQGEDVEKVRRATMALRERCPDLLVEGPLQYDAAVDPGVAASKMPDNPVAGRATVLIFPDLNTGNNVYKAVQRSAGATAIGPVLQGLNRPINDLSRGCTVADIVNTVAITAIQAQNSTPEDKTSPSKIPQGSAQ